MSQRDPMDLLEDAVVHAVMNAEDCRPLVAALAGALGQVQLADAFTSQPRRLFALACMAVLRGEVDGGPLALIAYLEGLPLETALATLAGKRPPANPGGGSAMDAIGGPTALFIEDAATAALAPRTAAAMAAHGESMRHAFQARAVADLLRRAEGACAKLPAGQSPARIVAHAIDRLASLQSGGIGQSLGDHAAAMLAEADAYRAAGAESRRASWGLRPLDLLCPLRPGALIVLAAPPGAGKSSLALQAAAASGADPAAGQVGIVSLEMTGGELAAILAASRLRVAPVDIREGRLREEERREVDALVQGWQEAPALWVAEAGRVRFTAETVAAWARTRAQACAGRLSLLVIDYLQLIQAQDPRATEYATITEASRALKRLAMDLRVPVLALSQLSRRGREELRDRAGRITGSPEPRLSDLRGSGSIEQDADAVVFIHTPGEPQPHAPTIAARITVAKNRAGPLGSIDAWFFRRWQRFEGAGPHPPCEEGCSRGERLRQPPSTSEDAFADDR